MKHEFFNDAFCELAQCPAGCTGNIFDPEKESKVTVGFLEKKEIEKRGILFFFLTPPATVENPHIPSLGAFVI